MLTFIQRYKILSYNVRRFQVQQKYRQTQDGEEGRDNKLGRHTER